MPKAKSKVKRVTKKVAKRKIIKRTEEKKARYITHDKT